MPASVAITAGGGLDISGVTSSLSINSLSGGGTVSLGSKTLIINNAAGTLSGVIQDGGVSGGAGGIGRGVEAKRGKVRIRPVGVTPSIPDHHVALSSNRDIVPQGCAARHLGCLDPLFDVTGIETDEPPDLGERDPPLEDQTPDMAFRDAEHPCDLRRIEKR